VCVVVAVAVVVVSPGSDYIGEWQADDMLVIHITNASAAAPPLIAAPYSTRDNSPYALPQVESADFQVRLLCALCACRPCAC
jgi:hypothetical protein